jgi:hypothetical protein
MCLQDFAWKPGHPAGRRYDAIHIDFRPFRFCRRKIFIRHPLHPDAEGALQLEQLRPLVPPEER